MSKIELIEDCINRAIRRESKITPLALAVPFLGCLNARHLLNNLGGISTRYAEIGSHRGGSFCSAVFKNDNLLSATAIDNFLSDETADERAKPDFLENVEVCLPKEVKFNLIHKDSFHVDLSEMPSGIDLYLMDGSHDEDSQCRALTYYLPVMADEFIFLVDDSDWPDVIEGTKRGLRETGAEILFEQKFQGNDHDNDGWYNGYWVFLLRKK
jgi:methyltransferase family protein